jgi:hypothetical protein
VGADVQLLLLLLLRAFKTHQPLRNTEKERERERVTLFSSRPRRSERVAAIVCRDQSYAADSTYRRYSSEFPQPVVQRKG